MWLNPIEAGMPRAGDLCTRHADGMAPPKGWDRVDRRNEPFAVEPVEVTDPEPVAPVPLTDDLLPTREPVKRKRKPTVKKRWEEVPSLFEPAVATVPAPVVGAPVVPTAIPAPAVPALPVPAPVVADPVATEPVATEPVADEPVAEDPAADANRWMPRFVTDEDLGGVLDATTPLLSRAFNNARPSDDADDPKPTD